VSAPEALFVYGELRKPAVLRAILDRVPAAEIAALRGYRRQLHPESGYFRASAHAQSMIVGLLLRDIVATELDLLDRFENVAAGEYRRARAEATPLDGRGDQPVWVYLEGRSAATKE